MPKPHEVREALEDGERRGRLLWERRLLLALGDGVAVAVSFVLAFNLRTAEVRHEFFAVPRQATLIVLVTWYICAELVEGYRLTNAANPRAAFGTALSALFLSFIALLTLFFIVPYQITRPTIVLWMPLAAILVLVWRISFERLFGQALFAGNLVIVGDRRLIERVWSEAARGLPNLYHLLETIEPKFNDSAAARLLEVANANTRPEIVVGVSGVLPDSLSSAIITCCERGLRVRSLSDLYEEMTGRLLLNQLNYQWLMSLPMRDEVFRLHAVTKRAVDIVVGTAALAILCLLYPFVALAIWLDDRGPVLYRQTRVGRYGRLFEILKLRTMRAAIAGIERQTDTDDPRVTRVGRVLRRLHLDELPQALNILRGDMSLVGPRPEQPRHAALMRREIEFYNIRLSVRPGLTGWAQVNFGYGAGVEGARKKLSYDLYYIRRQGFGLDLLILARTARAIFSFRGR